MNPEAMDTNISSSPNIGIPLPNPSSTSASNIYHITLSDKINRELFVGNVPPGTCDELLIQFLNVAMQRTNLCAADHNPIINCRSNTKFAFIECTTIQDANKALNLNGIPFMGVSLRISRPSRYAGPHVSSITWQELTGQAMNPNDPLMSSLEEEKVSRELFIGNTTEEMTEDTLTEFLGKVMEQIGLTTMPGNPVVSCRLCGKYAFVELRSREETENALNLNNIPYLGAQLKVGRPSKYSGPETPHGNWEDILAKFLSGELVLPSQGKPLAAQNIDMSTRVVELKNMLTVCDLQSDQEYDDIMADIKEECARFGALLSVIIPRSGVGVTKIFLEYASVNDAEKAVKELACRTFDGRRVVAGYFDEEKFAKQNYSD